MSLLTLSPGETSIQRIVTIIRQVVQYMQNTRKPTTGLTIYIDPVNGKTSNDGLSFATALKTIQAGVHLIASTIDANGGRANITLADGTYTAGASSEQMVGQFGCTIAGQVGHSAAVIINVPDGLTGFATRDYGEFSLDNMTIVGGVNSFGVTAGQFGILDINAGVVFGSFGAGGIHVLSDELGSVNLSGNYAITGGAANHVKASNGGIVQGIATVPISAGLTFTDCFIKASLGGIASMAQWSFTGASGITGQKFNVIQGGLLLTGQVDPNTIFPGNSAGAITAPGEMDFYGPIGTWTPTDGSGASLSLTVTDASYQLLPGRCLVSGVITYPATASGANSQINGLPAPGRNGTARFGAFSVMGQNNLFALVSLNASNFQFFDGTTVAKTNANLSGATLRFTFTYLTS